MTRKGKGVGQGVRRMSYDRCCSISRADTGSLAFDDTGSLAFDDTGSLAFDDTGSLAFDRSPRS